MSGRRSAPRRSGPFHFKAKAEPFAFAGVWDTWSADGRAAITSFSIVTAAAAPSTAQYHDRMTVVLEEDKFDDWMRAPPELAVEIMKPYEGEIDMWEVGPDVGNVSNNKPELLDRVGLL